MRTVRLLLALCLVVAVAVAIGGAGAHAQPGKKDKAPKMDHAPLHYAIHLLQAAKKSALRPKYDHYGDHRHKAVHEIDQATKQLREALKRAKANGKGEPAPTGLGVVPPGNVHAPLHHALKLLREAESTARKPKYAAYGDHRHKGVVHIEHARKQLHEAIKRAEAFDSKK